MRVLFIDFDGVMHPLNKGKTFTNTHLLWDILRRIPDLQIVISSSWREHYAFERMVGLLTREGGEVLSPRIVGVTPQTANTSRGQECVQWLINSNIQDSQWLAIDDDPNLFKGFEDRLICTNPRLGLTEQDVERVVGWFNN